MQIFVEPLKLLFEVIFFYAYKATRSAGLSIVAMSLLISLLLLPLYFRADKLEKEQRLKKRKMSFWVDHINKTFRGDERIMMLQAYYRENDYRTTDVFKESLSLLLQIPFFIAAYSFLSNLKMLHGLSLGPVKDLGMPDALLTLGSISINLLPILMTLINIISGFIYTEKGNIKDKLKILLIALVFLVLLYRSPSGLVLYWTLNNVFSLVKNIITLLFRRRTPRVEHTEKKTAHDKEASVIILLSLMTLAVLTGLMIPSEIISQNPAEFINTYAANPPMPGMYLLNSAAVAAGTFLIWIPIFYFLTREKTEKVLVYVAPVAALCGIVNFAVFNLNFGLLSKKLIYEYVMSFTGKEIFFNLMGIVALTACVLLFAYRYRKTLKIFLVTALVSVSVFAAMNIGLIAKLSPSITIRNSITSEASVPITRTGKNVIVIMMDRMIGAYVPYIFNDRPDVAEQFDGFTYYPNTVSFGAHTNFASPALYGGYEYTPARINARFDELLVDKHNEALRVMPVLFADNGWNVSVGDPSYANYSWIPDVSIYDGDENINAFLMAGSFNDTSDLFADAGEEYEIRLNRNLFCYGVMKTLPIFLQPYAYSEGSYNYIDFYFEKYVDDAFIESSSHVQTDMPVEFLEEYTALAALDDITQIISDPQNCFFMFSNKSSHEVCLLQEPDYAPASYVDNTEYDAAHEDRFTLDGAVMYMDTDFLDYAHYECTMASFMMLGDWFDYLRENGVYDNTRIIIVADHGYGLVQFDDLLVYDLFFDAEWVNPVLMVKDFGSEDFTVCDDFMTNADTPALAADGVIEDPVNPFTGNPLNSALREGDQLIYMSEMWNVNINNGTTFADDPDGFWLTVRDDIRDDSNWNLYDGEPEDQGNAIND